MNGSAGRDVRYLSDRSVLDLMGVPGRRCANTPGQMAGEIFLETNRRR